MGHPLNSRDITLVNEPLQSAFLKSKQEWEAQNRGFEMRLSSTYRNEVYQNDLYKKGRKQDPQTKLWVIIDPKRVVTHRDGYIKKSTHQLRRAIDVFIYNKEEKMPVWSNNEMYRDFYSIMKKHVPDIVWGGLWKSPYDPYHFEITS